MIAPTRLLMVLMAGLCLAAGCAADGRELADPAAWQTTTTRPLPTTSAPDQEDSPTGLSLWSPAFEPGDELPPSATCAGDNVFPALRWSAVAPEAVELAVSLSDQTDPSSPVLLWLMAGISPELVGLEAGTIPVGAFETRNGLGNPGYGQPCVESLTADEPDVRRDLQFRIHVMNQPSGVAPGGAGDASWDSVKARSIDTASLVAHLTADA